MRSLLAVVLGLLAKGEARGEPHRDVGTTQGAARGYLGARPPHFAFLGLPYAAPPTLRDRFKVS